MIVSQLLADAKRIHDSCRDAVEFANYEPSDFIEVDRFLDTLDTRGTFVELGSGLGVVTMLAALHGFESCGIENELSLVNHARGLARTYGISAEFICADYRDVPWAQKVDVIYAFPDPDDSADIDNAVKRLSSPGTRYVSYRQVPNECVVSNCGA